MTDQVRNSPACSEPPSRPLLCVTGCGFFGNPRTDNMCSVCHRKNNTTSAHNNNNSSSNNNNNSNSAINNTPSTAVASNTLTISTPNTMPQLNTIVNSQSLTPITPIQRAPAPSPFSMSLADALPDSLSVPFFESFNEPQNHDLNAASSSSFVSIESTPSSSILSNFGANLTENDGINSAEVKQPSTIKIEAPIATVAIPSLDKLVTPAPSKPVKSKCKVCSRKVGLAYFNCKCDENAMFCSSHRYPHAHDCSHSHRSDQQAKLAKANPIVKNDQFERL